MKMNTLIAPPYRLNYHPFAQVAITDVTAPVRLPDTYPLAKELEAALAGDTTRLVRGLRKLRLHAVAEAVTGTTLPAHDQWVDDVYAGALAMFSGK